MYEPTEMPNTKPHEIDFFKSDELCPSAKPKANPSRISLRFLVPQALSLCLLIIVYCSEG